MPTPARRSSPRELSRAPGKRHRRPPPSARGVKHSDEKLAKEKTVKERKRWARD